MSQPPAGPDGVVVLLPLRLGRRAESRQAVADGVDVFYAHEPEGADVAPDVVHILVSLAGDLCNKQGFHEYVQQYVGVVYLDERMSIYPVNEEREEENRQCLVRFDPHKVFGSMYVCVHGTAVGDPERIVPKQ